ncbi:glycerophosphodiester phosphodiesterase [Fredinandcohnia humi]
MLLNTIVNIVRIALLLSEEDATKVYIIGHRGAAGYAPENTIAAFDKAVELKADYIELDVQMTKDGELVVIHDPMIDRTTNGTGAVKDFTLQELKQYDAGSWFHSTFKNEKIPSFREIINRYSSTIGLLIELKDPELYPGIEVKLAKELKRANLHKRTDHSIIVQSFNRESIRTFHRLLPSVPTGILSLLPFSSAHLKEVSKYSTYLNCFYPILTPRYLREIKKHGLTPFVWPVNTRDAFQSIYKTGINGITTDFPNQNDPLCKC